MAIYRQNTAQLIISCFLRVVVPGTKKTIGPHTFTNWGAHCDGYPCAYFTAAAAIGMRREEVDTFAKRLEKVFTKFKRRHGPKVENPLGVAGGTALREDLAETQGTHPPPQKQTNKQNNNNNNNNTHI